MKTCYIYHHNDMDGRTSGGIIYKALQTKFSKEGTLDDYEFKFYEINYLAIIDAPIDKDNMYVFVDYSFSNPANVEYLKRLCDNNCSIVWIDHHQTSLDLIDKYISNNTEDEIGLGRTNVITMVDKTHCAAYLCYEYGLGIVDEEYVPDEDKIPDLIKYIDSYDCWKFYMDKTAEFNDGIYVSGVRPKTWIDEVLGEGAKPYAIFKPDAVQRKRMGKYIKDTINTGTAIKAYKDKENAYLIKTKSFEFQVDDYSDMLHVQHYKGLAVNGRGNSSLFGDKVDEYDIVCPFSYDGKHWKYSFYSKNKHGMASLAEILGSIDALGGGGHSQAAGFQTKDLIISADGVIEIFKSNKFGKQKYIINVTGRKKTYHYKIK